MTKPKLAVSGYRGIWGDTLTKEIAQNFAHAFARFILKRNGTRVFLGRDARISGETLVETISQILATYGLQVTILGLVPTPTVLFLVREESYDGAIIVTASHNTREYNGLKFVTSRGMFTNTNEVLELQSYIDNPLTQTSSKTGLIDTNTSLAEKHIAQILKHIDIDSIKSKKFKVVLDPINSAGSIITPTLLEKLGCDVTIINGIPNGDFAHTPEPLAVNLTGLRDKVKEVHADIGFAQDPDADRLVLCDETGNIVFEEYGIACCIKSVLDKNPGDVTVNLSTSKTIELLADMYNKKTYRSKVGEAHVVEKLLETESIVGGEGSGGIIYPTINPCRDSLVGIALILELLSRTNKTISTIVHELPQLIMMKDKFPINGDLTTVYASIQAAFPDAIVDITDGMRLDFADDGWIQLRASNTEPLVRIMGEAHTKERIEFLMEEIKKALHG